MELSLRLINGTQVQVARDGLASHTFDLSALPRAGALSDPVAYGQALYAALFPAGSPAARALPGAERLALVLDEALDALPWEFLRGEEEFLALEMPLARLIPPESRRPAPDLSSTPLRMLAVPSNPLTREAPPLDVAGEWRRLRDATQNLTHQVRLVRVHPPTLDNLRAQALAHAHSVVHFMGHGGQAEGQAVLLFEDEAGGLDRVRAKDVSLSLRGRAFLVTLNACASAAPGETSFANLACLLVGTGAPYALGMRFSIPDEAALAFSRALYADLARGVDVEEAVFQARRSLLRGNPLRWLVGVPVLYSSLSAPAGGFATPPGRPQVDERQPRMDVVTLPRAVGTFQGRVDELLELGKHLTRNEKIVTIHGPGGQGKTALAREAVERFGHAWPGGVWAISLEHVFALERFTLELARLLKIDPDGVARQVAAAHPNQSTDTFEEHVRRELERRILSILNRERALLVLDNAETFMQAVEAKDKAALDLAAFLKDKILGTQTGLLVTSREHLGWEGEKTVELGGLLPEEGARLFSQSAPGRGRDAVGPQREEISHKVGGHPLSLRLLGGAFDAAALSLDEFVHEVELALRAAEDKYRHADHRHHTLYASIQTSARFLDAASRALVSGLWIFAAPFMPEAAAEIFTPPDLPEAQTTAQREQIFERLATLERRGLLSRQVETLADGSLLLHQISPTVRLFAQNDLEQALSAETLRARMGNAYYHLLLDLRHALERSRYASYLVGRCREDLEACAQWLEPAQAGWYADHLGWVLQWIGDRRAGLRWLEQALETAQGTDRDLEMHIVNNLALVHRATGRMVRALELFEQALSVARAAGDRAAEATALNNIAMVYSDTGQPGRALELYQQVLPIRREVGDRADEAATLHNMASVYADTGRPEQALDLYEQALSIRREASDRVGEAATLNNLAALYNETGEPGRALELYDQALALMREVDDRAGAAATLANLALVYSDTGYPARALELYEQALPLLRAVGDRQGEATTLNNLAGVYRTTGEPGQALELYEQALPLIREVDDRAGEARTLNNLGMTYSLIDQPARALELYQQSLLIRREVDDRAGEAKTLNNMGMLHAAAGQPARALELYAQALPLMRAVGDRAGEAATLNNLANAHTDAGQPARVLELFEQALPLLRAVGDQVGEATALMNMATLFYTDLSRPQEAIGLMQGAIRILQALGLNQNASGITIPQLQSVLEMMKNGKTLA